MNPWNQSDEFTRLLSLFALEFRGVFYHSLGKLLASRVHHPHAGFSETVLRVGADPEKPVAGGLDRLVALTADNLSVTNRLAVSEHLPGTHPQVLDLVDAPPLRDAAVIRAGILGLEDERRHHLDEVGVRALKPEPD